MDTELTICRSLAPEDIQRGDYILPLIERHEFIQPSPFGGCDASTPYRVVALNSLPSHPEGPMKVLDVCLPFLLVRKADTTCAMLDIRQMQVGRLDSEFARRCVKKLRPKADTAPSITDASI